MSLQVCPCCGWSKVTSYRGLRIHQGKMGCTPKGMRVMEHQQQYLCEKKIQWNSTLDVDCIVKIESLDVPDPSLQVCHCGWTKRTTYQGLLIHQGRMECTLKGAMIPEKQKYDSRYNTEEKEHQWKPLPEMFPEGLRGSCRKSSAAAKMEYSSPEPPHSTQRGYSARYLEAPQALTQAQLQSTKADLEQKIERRRAKVDEVDAALKVCMDQLENELCDVEAIYTSLSKILEAAQAAMLKPLKKRRHLLKKEAKELKDELDSEINKLQVAVSELENISALDDHILFLQRYPSLSNQDDMKDWTKVELNTSLSFGSMRKTTEALIEKFQQELDRLSSIGEFAEVKSHQSKC
uniref:TRIM8/14/16/25/29/45/65 coiled-coil region domain-containing protein n=1 Tax=Oryzias latipes TaxID=8090 RepID=A0A3P9ID02_ORYLA